jgi:acyl-coenzyme A synthetase/AMP-(fatty) acid ligase/pimeloyl-ACP methyl ester carboxylesterase
MIGVLDPARLPPSNLDGLEPTWSRLVSVDLDDTQRTFHVLDTMPDGEADLTLLCVHGNPSWSYLWRHLLASLPGGVRGIAIDHLDMGFSDRTGTVRRLADRIDDLCALTESLALTGPVVTVAHDWGGPISLGWAQRHIPQLRGVVLTNTAVHQPAGSPAPRVIRAARSRSALRRATIETTAFITGAFEMSHPRTPKKIRKGFLAPYLTKERREAIGTFVVDIPLEDDHPTAPVLDGVAEGLNLLVDTPALLLWGSKDLVFSDLYLHDLEARLPHADVHRWAHAGHFVTEDANVASAIVDWIGTLADTPEPSRVHDPTDLTRVLDRIADPALATVVAIREMTGDQRSINFGELANRVDRTAHGLATIDVVAGDRVAVMIPPGIDLAVAVYACWRLGAVPVLVDGALSPKQMGAALAAAYPKHLIGIPKALAAAFALRWPGRRIAAGSMPSVQKRLLRVEHDLAAIEAAEPSFELPSPHADAEAGVVFTSGSTGPSKGVRYSHRQIAAQRDAIAKLYDIDESDGLVAAFAPFALYGPMLGITSVVPDMDVSAPGSLGASRLAEAVDAIDATMVFASPAALENLVRTEHDVEDRHIDKMRAVRLLLSAGAPVRTSLLDASKVVFPNAIAHTPYGMTEVLPVASISLPELHEAGAGDGVCVGFPLPGVDVDIRPLSDDHKLGEIVVRAPHARTAYDRLWHTSHLASQPNGWHVTGDVGFLDDERRLWVGGRLSHIIQTASGPMAPVGLEKAVEALDSIASAAVVGVGPEGNQQVVVVVERVEAESKPRFADLDLVDAIRGVSVTDVVAVFEIPKLPVDRRHNSKIDRTAVAQWASVALAGGSLGKI